MTYVVDEKCIKCKHMDCVEVCPVDCFYEGENMLVIHPDECIDCGVCEPECPAEAILSDTEEGISANLGAKYTIGQVSVGYTEGGYQPAVASSEITYYANKFMGIQFDVNDQLSLSYNVDESEKNARAAITGTNTSGTKTVTTMEQKSLQLAYTTGGMTIGVAQAEVDNSDYTAGKSETQSVVSLAIAF